MTDGTATVNASFEAFDARDLDRLESFFTPDASWIVPGDRQLAPCAGGVDRDVAYVAAGDEVNDAVDAADRDKYGRYPSYVEPMVTPQARATTLRLVPQDEDRA